MSTFVSLQELADLCGHTTNSLSKTLYELKLFTNGQPTLLALVLGVAKKHPYGHREGQPRHDYRWATAKTLTYLKAGGLATVARGAPPRERKIISPPTLPAGHTDCPEKGFPQ